MVSLERAKRLLKSKETQKEYEMLKTPVAKFTPVEALKPEAVIAPDVSKITAREALAMPMPSLAERTRFAQQASGQAPMPKPLSMNLGDNATIGGYLANRAISGLVGVTEGLEATQNLLRGQDKSGLPPTELQLQQQRLKEQRLADRLATAEAGESMPKAARFVGDITEAGTGMLPTIALSAASGGVMGIPFIMTSATGNSYEQARREGADHGQALKYGIASGLIEGAIEGIIGGIPGMKGVADPLIDAATKGIKSKLMKEVAKYGLNALGEGVEEALASAIDPLLRRGTFDETAKADLNEILHSFLVGTATSALMQAPTSLAGIRSTNPVQQVMQNVQQEVMSELQDALTGDFQQDIQQFTPIGGEYAAASIETPALTVQIPTEQTQARIFGEPEIPKGQRERGVSRNIRTDINSPEGLRASLEQEPLTYTQKSNIETLSRAEQIMSEGYETARAKLDEMLDRMDTEAAPLAVMLAREAWTKGDKKGSRQIVAHAAEKAIQAGRFGQAFRILRDTDPASLLMSMQNQIKKLNEDGRKQYGKRWTDIELTDTEIELIMNTPLESEAELQELQQIIGKRIANDLPSDIMEKFNAWRRVAMLFNPKTHIRNIGGNILMSGLQSTSDIVATGLEKIFVPKDQRTKALFWKNDQNLVKMVNETWEVEKNSIENISRYDISNLRALGFDKRIFQSDFLQALNDLTMKGLNLADTPFVKAAYTNSLGQFMKARGLTEVTQEAKDYAKRRALEATFKETNEMASILNRLKQKPVVGTLVEGAIPFTKTPANITMRAIDYSPGGLLKALYDAKTGKTATKTIEDLSKGLTGTALMALGMWLQKIGWARVERSRSEKAEGLYRELGEQTNSIITPYGSYTFDWAQPFAVPLAMGIAIMETISKRKDGESWANALLEGLYAGGDTIFNMTMLKNIKDIFGSGGSPTKKIFSIPVAYIEQFIPSISGQAARTIDPIRRSTYDPDPMKQEWKRIKSRIPFASKTLEPMLNVWGEEQRQGGILEQFISPGYFATPTDDHVTLEVARLYDAFKDTDMLPKVAPAKFSSDKVEYVLSAEQRTQFQRDMGQANYNDIARLISTAEYKRLTDAQKVKKIKKIVNDNYEDAKEDIIKASALKGN